MSESSRKFVIQLFEILNHHGVDVVVSEVFAKNSEGLAKYAKTATIDNITSDIDAIFSLGGDGTMLDTLAMVGRNQTPILGINTGRLGFLATIAKDQIEHAMDLFLGGKYSIDLRTLICLETKENLFTSQNYCLNEFAILRRETSSMIVVKAYLNGQYLNTYWADGLMVATPTGSTGYSLSCGGPILAPQSKDFVITPVSPHNLNVRPLIVPDTSELTFEVESGKTNYLISLDSRSEPVIGNIMLKVRKADFSANLIKIEGDNFFDTLKNKLSWGLDKRN